MKTSATEKKSPWHDGEKSLQQKVGVSEKMEALGPSIIRPYMPEQHREFYSQLPFIVAGSVDAGGDAWATLIPGKPGFISSPSKTQLDIAADLDPNDPAVGNTTDGAGLGLLGIELHTRRRNRMNGHISGSSERGFKVDVEHSFGNCPQYIQLRKFAFVRDPNEFSIEPVQESKVLTNDYKQQISRADTFFVASYANLDGNSQIDISHRGGKPGFVRVNDDGSLTIPDYAGNLFFNTLGNLISNPKSGLVFPDFETGDLLHLTGDAQVILDSPEIAAFQGAERLWTFKPRRIILRPNALPLRWDFQDYSPNVLLTGSWKETAERLEVEKQKLIWRPFRVTKIIEESAVIKSFWLKPADEKGIAKYEAGQHLPIRLSIPGHEEPMLRTYTLSLAPSDSAYRISVKHDGLVSSHLHRQISVHDVIEARAPQGNFTIDSTKTRPVVMLAAGVGITPFVAMTRHLVYEGARTRTMRPAWMFQAARTGAERAFDNELEKLVVQSDGQFRLVRLLDETDEPDNAQNGVKGRISIDILKAVLPFDDYDFYLCGPPPFMETLYNGLRELNIPDKRIFFEAFGPASVKRKPDSDVSAAMVAQVSKEPVAVSFASANNSATWEPGKGTLLDLAEEAGLSPPFSCRMGSCGSCKTKVLSGKVVYHEQPNFPLEEGEALICCAVPAAISQQGNENTALTLDL